MRQLAESKDSLQFSNHLCEQLELKVEELDSSHSHLSKLGESRQCLLRQRTSRLSEMEESLSCARDEADRMRAELNKLRRERVTAAEESVDGPWSKREHSSNGGKGEEGAKGGEEGEGEAEADEEVATLRELSQQLHNTVFQKKRLQREVDTLLSENTSLSKNLEKTEADLGELQERFVELSETQTPETPSSSSFLLSPGHMTPTTPTTTFALSSSRVSKRLDSHSPLCPNPTPLDTSSQLRSEPESLFSELDAQYGRLQQSYGDLLHTCTCSASFLHKAHGSREVNGVRDEGVKVLATNGSGSFKELFDEVFATLQQTARVADRLIEGGGN